MTAWVSKTPPPRHPQHRWSVSYPSDWKLDDKDGFVKISKGQAILGIHTFVDVAGKSLDEVADAAIQRWEQKIQKVSLVLTVLILALTLLPCMQRW